jgi:hypothetical protein
MRALPAFFVAEASPGFATGFITGTLPCQMLGGMEPLRLPSTRRVNFRCQWEPDPDCLWRAGRLARPLRLMFVKEVERTSVTAAKVAWQTRAPLFRDWHKAATGVTRPVGRASTWSAFGDLSPSPIDTMIGTRHPEKPLLVWSRIVSSF